VAGFWTVTASGLKPIDVIPAEPAPTELTELAEPTEPAEPAEPAATGFPPEQPARVASSSAAGPVPNLDSRLTDDTLAQAWKTPVVRRLLVVGPADYDARLRSFLAPWAR
jgi:hypothetical protein